MTEEPYDEQKPELGGAVGRKATLACRMGEHDLCSQDSEAVTP